MSTTSEEQSAEEVYHSLFSQEHEAGKTSKAARAYEIALDIRKFEIELYWKRATYFWAFTGAALAAYLAALTGAEVENQEQALLLTSCVGLVFAAAWYLVNRASKYWQSNWEFHVDMLEDCEAGPLYKTRLETDVKFWSLGGAYPFSVSKINQWLSLFVAAIFAFLALNTTAQYYSFTTDWQLFPTACLLITVLALTVLIFFAEVSPPKMTVAAKVRATELASITHDG